MEILKDLLTSDQVCDGCTLDNVGKKQAASHGAAPPEEGERIGGRDSPQRRCIVTGIVRDKDDMVRFIVAPDGAVVPDVEGTFPGRGYWVCCERKLLERAVRRKLFAKAARRAVTVPPGLLETTTQLLARRALSLVGLARRAGVLVAGFEAVCLALRTGRVGPHGKPPAVLIEASDGRADGRRRVLSRAEGLPVVDCFEAGPIGQALGRDQIVHAVMGGGGLAERFLTEARRYRGVAGLLSPKPEAPVSAASV